METSIILIILSLLVWIIITIKCRNDKKAFYIRAFITVMLILFWCLYFFVLGAQPGAQCSLAALVACCYGIVYRK